MSNMFTFKVNKEAVYRTPKDIIEEQCKFLKEITDDYVIGKVTEYSGNIYTYTEGGLSGTLSKTMGKTVDIQTQLGELSDSLFTYDFFLSSIYTPNYMYRVMFLRHGITPYPLNLVLDEEIATEISLESELKCNNEQEFENILSKTLNSQKFSTIVQNLYLLNKQNADEMPF